jgi:hypothetical protein
LEPDGVLAGLPELPGEFHFTLQAVDSSTPAQVTNRQLTLAVAPEGLAIVTTNPELPWTSVGSDYRVRFAATGGQQPYTWSVDGALPPGLSISRSGVITGVPGAGGQYSILVRVNDSRRTASRTFTLHISPAQVDKYGGIVALHSPSGGKGYWRVEKIGKRWAFITPEGNAFWMRMVWFIYGDEHVDERKGSYAARTTAKYGAEATKWEQANRRLKSWGFNAIGPYSYRMVLPTDEETEWGGAQPVKLPFVVMGPQPSITGRKEGVFKNIYGRLDPAVQALNDLGDATFPDVFDPEWERNTLKLFAQDNFLIPQSRSPYFVGAFSDDVDNDRGFGSGPEFPSDPSGKTHPHLGYIALVTAPEQRINRYAAVARQGYLDQRLYTKYALRDFLRSRYVSIAALNAAWGSTYTSFDSGGGWPSGTGLLDENGRPGHKWLGTGDPELSPQTKASPKMVKDLDDFLYQIASRYLSVERVAYKKVVPNGLFFGPSTIGAWWSPPRAPILRAAAENLDVIALSTDCSKEQMDWALGVTGDVPIVPGIGSMANPDSSQWRQGKAEQEASWAAKNQHLRGQRYRNNVESLFTYQSPSGSNPAVGILWWAWTDSVPEERNWGLVTLMDNAYDGWEGGITHGTDAWGYPMGGEEKNYGDFLGPVREENFSIMERLVPLQRK